jgi:hypothetical protein
MYAYASLDTCKFWCSSKACGLRAAAIYIYVTVLIMIVMAGRCVKSVPYKVSIIGGLISSDKACDVRGC